MSTTVRIGLVLLLAAAPAMADDIIHFTSGSSLRIRGYEVDGEMLKIDLGSNGIMSFPLSQVESIERADGVTVRPDVQANRMVDVERYISPESTQPVTGGSGAISKQARMARDVAARQELAIQGAYTRTEQQRTTGARRMNTPYTQGQGKNPRNTPLMKNAIAEEPREYPARYTRKPSTPKQLTRDSKNEREK